MIKVGKIQEAIIMHLRESDNYTSSVPLNGNGLEDVSLVQLHGAMDRLISRGLVTQVDLTQWKLNHRLWPRAWVELR